MASRRINFEESPKTILKALKVSRSTYLPLAAVCSFGLFFSLTLPLDPALATTTEAEVPSVTTQSFTVSAEAKTPEISRDGYSATPQAEIDAKHAAEAEAARVAAEAEAAAEAQRERDAEASRRDSSTSTSTSFKGYTAAAPTTSYSGQAIVDYAEQFVGVVPYGYGNDPSDSFSCDGLTQYVFGQFGISLPRTVVAQSEKGVRVSASEARAGDLVIWPGQHVGIYDGNGGIIHSPDFGRKVTHASGLWGSYYFVRIA